MKTNFFPKLLLLLMLSLSLYSCTTDEMPAQENNVSANDLGTGDGGPVIPPGPRP